MIWAIVYDVMLAQRYQSQFGVRQAKNTVDTHTKRDTLYGEYYITSPMHVSYIWSVCVDHCAPVNSWYVPDSKVHGANMGPSGADVFSGNRPSSYMCMAITLDAACGQACCKYSAENTLGWIFMKFVGIAVTS